MIADAKDQTNFFCISGTYHADYDDVYFEVDSLSEGMAFIDVGANAGLFSIVAAKRVGKNGVVISFEPSMKNFSLLVQNVLQNGFKTIFPINAAIGLETEITTFAGGSDVHSGVGHLAKNGGEAVLQINFDKQSSLFLSIIGQRRIAIKVDVEGAELLVLSAMRKLICDDRVDVVIAEINYRHMERFDHNPAMLYRLMDEAGFKYERGIDTAKHFNEIFRRVARS